MYKKFIEFFTFVSKSSQTMLSCDEKYYEALALFSRGERFKAIAICGEVLSLQPNHIGTILLAAEIATADLQLARAIDLYRRAISIDSKNSRAYYKLGNTLKDCGQMKAALESYDRAAALDPSHGPTFCNRGVVLQHLNLLEAALSAYEKGIALNPQDAVSHYNRASLLRQLRRSEEALASYTRAITVSPAYVEAYCNRGMLWQEMGNWEAALADYDRAIASKTDFAEAHYNRAEALIRMKHFAAAIASYDRSIALKPTLPFALGMRCHAKMHLCDWSFLSADTKVLAAVTESTSAVATPFMILTLIDSPLLNHKIATSWVDEHHSLDHSLPSIPRRAGTGKIRVGYFSSDMCEHPVAVLAAQFLELHDRSKYEVIGFSFGPNTQDPLRQRLEKSFDQFFDVRGTSDEDVALLARSLNLDIAVDLNGHTAGSRTGIFALRAAPVQINFLGFPGTMGAEYIDYMIGDATVIPEDCKQHYSEKIIYLPDSFLPHDSGRTIASHRYTREQLGLPPGAVVFCCFNSSYKIVPGTFESWMRILSRADGSILWLSHYNATAVENLRREAQHRRIDPQRLIFAERMPSAAEHLARLRTADLFLDTLPYNAHATALDALWSGVPILTCIGQAFAGRVAASLLKSVGLPELITSTPTQYEDLAVELAQDPQRLAGIRLKLEQNRLTTPLFDTALFTKNLEKAYALVHERYQAGLPPDHVELG